MTEIFKGNRIPITKVYDSIPELDSQPDKVVPPTEEETFNAKRVYMEGMGFHYPSIDPRLGLLGMQDSPHGYLYKTKAYGYELVKISTRTQKIIDYIISMFYHIALVYIGYRIGGNSLH